MIYKSEIVLTRKEYDRLNYLLAYKSDNYSDYETIVDNEDPNSFSCKFENGDEIAMLLLCDMTGLYLDFVLYFPEDVKVDGTSMQMNIFGGLDPISAVEIEYSTDEGVDTYVIHFKVVE